MATGSIEPVTKSVHFKWTIPNYLQLCRGDRYAPYITSHHFPMVGRENKILDWNLYLYPNNKGHMALFLHLTGEDCVRVRFQLSILDRDEKQTNIRTLEYDYQHFLHDYEIHPNGFPYFIASNELMNRSQELLADDGSLIICCHIEQADGASETPPTNRFIGHLNQYSDVVFLVDGQEFYLHKFILAALCPVLYHTFEVSDKSRIEISDMKQQVFAAVVRYIYTDQVDDVKDMAEDLFVAAHRYNLTLLKCKCEIMLMDNMCIRSASRILILADLHASRALREYAVNFISRNLRYFFYGSCWKSLPDSFKMEILVNTANIHIY